MARRHLYRRYRVQLGAACVLIALLVALPRPAAGQLGVPEQGSVEDAGGAQDEVPKRELPAPVEEAQGTCETPRQAWLQLLFWLGNEHWDPSKASTCFDAEHISADEAAARAVELKQILDANGWRISASQLPTDPDYVDPERGAAVYEDPAVEGRGIYVVRHGDYWLFSSDTVDLVPELYPGITRHILNSAPGWLRVDLLGVEAWKYLGVIALILIALGIQKVIAFVINAYLRRLLADKPGLDRAVRRAERPVGGLAMAATFYVGFPQLLFPLQISQIAIVATQALAAFSMVWLGFRIIDVIGETMAAKAATTESKLDEQLVPLLRKTLKVILALVGGLFVLQNLDVDVSSLLAGLGIGGLAFALAARDTIANFFGSVMIFVDKPFQLGDWVVVGEVEGVVEEVGFRTTKVRTFYDSLVTVPNASVVDTAVDNYGMRSYRRYFTTLSLHYGTPPAKVQAFCEAVRAIVRSIPEMRKDFYLVEFTDFADSALQVMVYTFIDTDSWNTEMRTRSRLNLEIMRAAEQLGVRFAMPTRTLHVDNLVNPGQDKPTHSGPTEAAALASVIDGFGPGGRLGKPQGFELTPHGYDSRLGAGGGTSPDEDSG